MDRFAFFYLFVISFTPINQRPNEFTGGPFRKSDVADVEWVYSAVIFTSRRDTLSLVSLFSSPFHIPSLCLSLYVDLSSQRPFEIRDAEGVAEPPRAGRKSTLNLVEPPPVRNRGPFVILVNVMIIAR